MFYSILHFCFFVVYMKYKTEDLFSRSFNWLLIVVSKTFRVNVVTFKNCIVSITEEMHVYVYYHQYILYKSNLKPSIQKI